MLSRLDGWLGVGCLVSLTSLMLAEVIVRALSNIFPWVPADIPVAWEYSSYLMAACFTFGAAMTLRAGGHIRVTLVLARVSPAVRRWMETVLAALGTCVLRLPRVVDGLLHLAQLRRGQTSVSSGTLVWIPAGLRHLRHGAAGDPVRRALLPGAVRPAARGCQHAGRRRRRMTHAGMQPIMLIVVVTMFAMLFGLFWPAACGSAGRSAVTGHAAAGAVPRHPARQAAGAVRLEHPHHAGAARPAAVHPDGRDPVPHAPVAIAVHGLAPWAGLLPGRLLHVNVVGCSIFAAISGSSAATTQVVGRIALAELTKRGYSKDIAIGSLAGAGTLGLPDPALEHHDHLRRAGRRLDRRSCSPRASFRASCSPAASWPGS